MKLLWADAWKILCESSFLLLHSSKASFGSRAFSPDAFHVQWFRHVCTRLCAGLCEASYGWKQLLSRQLGSSQSRITLLHIKSMQIWDALVICKSHFGVITRNIIFQLGGFLSVPVLFIRPQAHFKYFFKTNGRSVCMPTREVGDTEAESWFCVWSPTPDFLRTQLCLYYCLL